MKDDIFRKEYNEKFEFNEIVASVFDDMIERSVPFYDEILNLCVHFIMQNLRDFENQKLENQKFENFKPPKIYDLGCSTGNLLLRLDNAMRESSQNISSQSGVSSENMLKNGVFRDENIGVRLIGIDNSAAMIERARLKARAMNANVEFVCEDFLRGDVLDSKPDSIESTKSRAICALYTMQFVRPPRRAKMAKKIYDALQDGGIFLCAEKVISADARLEAQMIERYYDYKKAQGYSQGEIYKKREALENVLVPYSVDENAEMLRAAGFAHIEILFKWVNFALFYARK